MYQLCYNLVFYYLSIVFTFICYIANSTHRNMDVATVEMQLVSFKDQTVTFLRLNQWLLKMHLELKNLKMFIQILERPNSFCQPIYILLASQINLVFLKRYIFYIVSQLQNFQERQVSINKVQLLYIQEQRYPQVNCSLLISGVTQGLYTILY